MVRTFSILTAAAVLAAAFSSPAPAQFPEGDGHGGPVVAGNTRFATDLYANLREKDGNLFFSPYSISTALAMTYAGARNETAEQMAKVLHFGKDDKALHVGFGQLHRFLNNPKVKREFELKTANALWGQKGYEYLPDFIKLTENVYGAGLKDVDYQGATEEARKTINAWVEDQTNKKIKELLKDGMLTANTRLVLTNAIYFKAPWQHEFYKDGTKPGDFTLADGAKVKAPLMVKNEVVLYHAGEDFQLVELPYKNHELSMVVLLPKKADGIAGLEKQINAANLAMWLKSAKAHRTDVKLPKFKTTSEFSLNAELKKMGMPLAFDDKKADFSGMTTREKLYISAVVHKAFVDVHEKGTEAAAATAVIMNAPTGLPPQYPLAKFHADRPFVFLVRERSTGSVLFMGRVMDPTK